MVSIENDEIATVAWEEKIILINVIKPGILSTHIITYLHIEYT